MKTKQITEEELIDFKRDLQQKYPGSVGKIPGKGDAIFLQRSEQDDVIIYDSGTSIYSPNFTATVSPTKYANMKVAFDVAVSKGFRPSGAFASGWFEKRKLLIKQAREQFKEQTSVFETVENRPIRELKVEFQDEPLFTQQLQQPNYERISQRPQMIQRQPNFFGAQNPNAAAQQILKEVGGYKPYRQQKQQTFGAAMKEFAGMSAQARAAENASWGIFPKAKSKTKKGGKVGRPSNK